MRKKLRIKRNVEKKFFKLMNNSVFERTMMNVSKHLGIKLISQGNKYTECVSKSTFFEFFGKNFAAVLIKITMIKFIQPVYVEVIILDITTTNV